MPVEFPCRKVGIHHLCFHFLLWEILVNIALLSSSVTWCHYRCISWICFSPSLLAPFCPGLVRDLPSEGGREGGGGAGFVPRCVATASLGLLAPDYFHKFFGSPPAGHLPPKMNLPLLFFGKYLSEQMMFLSC